MFSSVRTERYVEPIEPIGRLVAVVPLAAVWQACRGNCPRRHFEASFCCLRITESATRDWHVRPTYSSAYRYVNRFLGPYRAPTGVGWATALSGPLYTPI